ncbi:MAG: hypothetical protein WBV82_23635 [Myxococcaceae bacterium]
MRALIALATLALFCSVAVLQSACGPQACTLIGCRNGVTLRIHSPTGAPATAFSGTVAWDGESVAFACPYTEARPSECLEGSVFFPVEAPPGQVHVTIQSTSDGSSFSGTVDLEETVSYPNGPECGPECRNASAVVTLQSP